MSVGVAAACRVVSALQKRKILTQCSLAVVQVSVVQSAANKNTDRTYTFDKARRWVRGRHWPFAAHPWQRSDGSLHALATGVRAEHYSEEAVR